MKPSKGRLFPAAAIVLLLGTLWSAEAASARQRMSFVPGERARFHSSAHRHAHHGRSARRSRHGTRVVAQPAAHRSSRASGDSEGDAAKAVPGAGFTMQDGVLTYPAPARFQPQNLKHR